MLSVVMLNVVMLSVIILIALFWLSLCWVSLLGNCYIDYLNFRHCQVRNFKILNQFKWNRNFAVIFRKYRKSTKYFATSWKPSVIPLKFHEMSLVSWNPINCCKFLQFLIKFSKSLKDLRKILLKWLGKTVKYWLGDVMLNVVTPRQV